MTPLHITSRAGQWLHEQAAPDAQAAREAAARLGSADRVVAGILRLAGARTLALDTVPRLTSIAWSEEVATACVECLDRPRLLLNAAFVERWCPTPERLAFLVLHELAHVAAGHARLYPHPTVVHNIALDAVINRDVLEAVMAAHGDVRAFAALVEAAYAPHESPWFLLRPPPGWPNAPDWSVSCGAPEVLRSIHRRLYEPDWKRLSTSCTVQYGEIVHALRAAHPPGAADDGGDVTGDAGGAGDAGDTGDPGTRGHGDGTTPAIDETTTSDRDAALLGALLGGHGVTPREVTAISGGRDQAAGTLLADALHDLQGRLAGPGGDATPRPIRDAARDLALQHALHRLLRRTFVDGGARRTMSHQPRPARSVDRRHDRRAATREAVARLLGAPRPLLFRSRRRHPVAEPRDVLLYLDVSGSMADVLPALVTVLAGLHRTLHPLLYGWSTAVFPITAHDLARRTLRSTGGTNIEPVVPHLLCHPAVREAAARGDTPRALVVTDGYLGRVSPAVAQTLHQAGVELHVAVTAQGHTGDCTSWATSVTRLPG